MTAEALVMNKNGIAIAADSAIAVATGAAPRMFNTTDKLFKLTADAPVAVMIYGSSEFMHLPWDVLIEDYRAKRVGTSFTDTHGYAEDFLAYLAQLHQAHDDYEDVFLAALSAHFADLAEALKSTAVRAVQTFGQEEAAIRQCLIDQMAKTESELSSLPTIPGLDGLSREQFARKYRRLVVQARDYGFSTVVPVALTREIRRGLWRLAHLFATKEIFSSASSGIVIAGYGTEQLLPSVRCYRLEAFLPGPFKCKLEAARDISRHNQGIIIPFAQTELVYRFLQGVDKDYETYAFGLFSTLTRELSAYLINSYVPQPARDKASTDVQAVLKEKMAHIASATQSYRTKEFLMPVIEAVKNLPKQELAALAEALVQITLIRRKMSLDPETVREPVDVALISKSDGFVWIKRKRYYDPDLN